jgi:hypothetical protein
MALGSDPGAQRGPPPGSKRAEIKEKPRKLAKILEKQAKNGTITGFSIDKRWPKPHRKRRWVHFHPHKHWVS